MGVFGVKVLNKCKRFIFSYPSGVWEVVANLKAFLALDILIVEDQLQAIWRRQRIANKSRRKVKKAPVQRLFRGQPMIIISPLKIKKI